MSLTSVLGNAISGLNASQAQLRTASNNIANVNTPNYARQITDISSRTLAGQGAGVEVTAVRRIVDEYLTRELRNTSSDSEQYRAMSELHNRLQSLLGDPNKDSVFTARIDTLFSSTAGLTSNPAQSARRLEFVTNLQALGAEVGRVATDLQQLRAEADRQIGADVSKANAAVNRIYDLNQQIQREHIAGRETSILEDQRDSAIADLASVIDIQTVQLPNGAVGISTSSGLSLVDTVKYQISYQQSAGVGAGIQFPQILIYRIDPATGALSNSGQPLDERLRSGSLKGWLDMRDITLPAIASELGEMARGLGDQLNATHNNYTSVPAPTSLTGENTGLVATDLQGFTGGATFYAFDNAGNVAASVAIDFSALPAAATIGDVITAVNIGLGGAATLSFTGGRLSFDAGTASGVGIAQDTPPSARGGRGFSHFFGLNDLVKTSVSLQHETGLSLTSLHNFTGIVTLDVRGPGNVEPTSFALDFSAIGPNMSDVLTALNAPGALGNFFTLGLDINGALTAVPKPGYENYKLEPSTDNSDRAGTNRSFSNFFGIGTIFQTNAALGFGPVANIIANNSRLSLAEINPVGVPAITSGDNRGALALQSIAQTAISFAAAGSFGASTVRVQDFAARILSVTGQQAAAAEGLYTDREALKIELKTRAQDVSGVNMDEELSNMVIYQNAYNASARVISVTREMLDTLLQLT